MDFKPRYFGSIIVGITILYIYYAPVVYISQHNDVQLQRAIIFNSSDYNHLIQYSSIHTNVTFVLLLSYQRTGSSFLGELFNHNPEALYMFEPVDGVYAHMYGTTQYWTCRDDITNWPNGSQRIIPDKEIKEMVKSLHFLYNCEFSELPTEVLTHDFLNLYYDRMKSLQPFIHCSNRRINTDHLNHNCYKYTLEYCPQRLGENYTGNLLCQKQLLQRRKPKLLQDYLQCNSKLYAAIEPCIKEVSKLCRKKSMVVLKTVRFTMEMVADLLKLIPNLKIIHYRRDPRPVSMSRLKHETLRGNYAQSGSHQVVRAAQLYCQDLARDIRLGRQLKKLHPNKIMDLYFENLAMYPHRTATAIYKFIGVPMPLEVSHWLDGNTKHGSTDQTTRDSKNVVMGWRKKMSNKTLLAINRRCADLYELIGDIEMWPDTSII